MTLQKSLTGHDSSDGTPFLSLVIPAYNEEKRLKRSLVEIRKYLDLKKYDSEIIIVDDGSKDRTVEVASECLDGNDKHRILRLDRNRGKGHAVKKGMLEAKGCYAVFMDADLSTPIEELDKLMAAFDDGIDVVIGTRKNKCANVQKRQPYFRELLGKGFTLLSNMLVVGGISDFTCGFKGFRNAAGRAIFKRQSIDNWSFDAEILFLARKLGYGIKEVPVTWYDAEGTKVRLYRDIVGSLKGMFQIRINYLLGVYRIEKDSAARE
jgi:dolichyl-phosphate beta-glucosyltransferase